MRVHNGRLQEREADAHRLFFGKSNDLNEFAETVESYRTQTLMELRALGFELQG